MSQLSIKLLCNAFIVLMLVAALYSYKLLLLLSSLVLLAAMLEQRSYIAASLTLYSGFMVAVLLALGALLILILRSYSFFSQVPITEFVFGTNWKPYETIIDGKITKAFGLLPLLTGTFLIAIVATVFAIPFSILSAAYLVYFIPKRFKGLAITLIEVMSGIPTVVYGYFGIIVISPALHWGALLFGFDIPKSSALFTGIVVGLMITPLLIALIIDTFQSVPKRVYYGSLALGATRTETIVQVVLPCAVPGILSSCLLGLSRALGETMIVSISTGVMAKMTLNPSEIVTTMTVQIATLITGDQSFSSIETKSAYALAFTLFVVTWTLNAAAITYTNRCRKNLE